MMADDADYMQALVLGKKELLPRAGMSGLGERLYFAVRDVSLPDGFCLMMIGKLRKGSGTCAGNARKLFG